MDDTLKVTILHQDDRYLLIDTRAGTSPGRVPMQHLFKMNGLYAIISEEGEEQLQWKHWVLWDGVLYWSLKEIVDKEYASSFGFEYYDVVSNWVAEVLILRGET